MTVNSVNSVNSYKILSSFKGLKMRSFRNGRRYAATSNVNARSDQPYIGVTPRDVAVRMHHAFRILRRLPDPDRRFQAMLRSHHPETFQTRAERFAAMVAAGEWEKLRALPGAPSGQDIDRMNEALGWLVYVSSLECRTVLMARCAGARWRSIADRLNCSVTTAQVRYKEALSVISEKLTRQRVRG